MGAGAVGGYYGAALAGLGHAVTFVARGDHLRVLQERGLTIRSGGRSTLLHPVQAVADPAAAGGDFELVLFTVKAYDTEPAARALGPAVGRRTAVLTLQNGVENGERLGAVLGADRVLVGTTLIATTVAEPGTIEQAHPLRRIELGEPSGAVSPRVESIAAALRGTGTTVERNDPLFQISKTCCWWSGQSWPYATTQTLKAMANLLQNYKQDVVTKADYLKLLQTYAKTHRKDGKPYIAEACHPDTGSWEGHDTYNHSEHYFHSGYVRPRHHRPGRPAAARTTTRSR